MTQVKAPFNPETPTSLHFPNSSSIVSCPGFSSWDFRTPCSLIFHHGNKLPQWKWWCSAKHHAHINLSSTVTVSKEGSNMTDCWAATSWIVKWQEMRKGGEQPVIFLTCLSLCSCARYHYSEVWQYQIKLHCSNQSFIWVQYTQQRKRNLQQIGSFFNIFKAV